ncbi:unnamed protein product, partial [Allacma fusca]
YLTSMKR